MSTTHWKTFLHPGGVYQLEYPAHWDQLQKDEARSCGFGPHDRDDVGLWISIMPVSVDTDALAGELPTMLGQVIPAEGRGGTVRPDPTLRHHGVKADAQREGEGGHYWLIAGGDVVLFASSDVPVAERQVWNPIFERMLASLEITREDELALRRLTSEVLTLLRQRHPEEHFQLDEKGIRGGNRVVYLSNLHREVRAAPARRSEIIQHFVQSLGDSMDQTLGRETWADAQARLLPILKPRSYVASDSAARNSLVNDWLGDVVICYALRSKDIFRFVTTADADRWQMDAQALHEVAIANLCRLAWPDRLEGARQRDGGRVIVIATGDGMAASRLLHPDLHRLLSGPLGSPFRAGIPDRDTLVVYSDRHRIRQQTERQLRKDHRTSSYPITPRPFLVTPDGIALASP
jgi:uncharacterized protein YtpQ (UPF0354 family)